MKSSEREMKVLNSPCKDSVWEVFGGTFPFQELPPPGTRSHSRREKLNST